MRVLAMRQNFSGGECRRDEESAVKRPEKMVGAAGFEPTTPSPPDAESMMTRGIRRRQNHCKIDVFLWILLVIDDTVGQKQP